jgi:hypothetical protein
MKSPFKNLDTIQIIGFVISAVVSIGLLLSRQDSLLSVTLGFVLATLTQMFDVQKRLADSEERLIQASALSKTLYSDEWLLRYIQQIINDYQMVKNGWFELFKRRANDEVAECRDVIHSLAEGHMIAYPRGPYTFGAAVKNLVKKSYKHASALGDVSYWRSTYAEKALASNRLNIQNGIEVTRVFIQKIDVLRQITDVLIKHQEAGIHVYVAVADEIPKELCEDYSIADNVACAYMEASSDGHYKQQRISVEPIEVERCVRNFNMLLAHSRKLDEVLADLKSA